MLVLSRKEGESIIIYPSLNVAPDMTVAELFNDGPIMLTVERISGNQVRIGTDASRNLTVVRAELLTA